jgi:hypothetical protein
MLPDGKLTGVPFRRKRGYRTGIESIHHVATYDPNGRKSLVRYPGHAQCFFNRAKRLKQSSKIPEGMAEGDAPENGDHFRFGPPSGSGSRPGGKRALQAA